MSSDAPQKRQRPELLAWQERSLKFVFSLWWWTSQRKDLQREGEKFRQIKGANGSSGR